MSEEMENISRDVRALIKSLLEKGAEPSDISFVLCSLATELGLKVTEGSISVFPVVMTGIIKAVEDAVMEHNDSDEEAETDDTSRGATLH